MALRLASQPFADGFCTGVVHVMQILADKPNLAALRQLLERVEQYGHVLTGDRATELNMDFLVYLGVPDCEFSAKVGNDFNDRQRQT
jgi:hypothetical protein